MQDNKEAVLFFCCDAINILSLHHFAALKTANVLNRKSINTNCNEHCSLSTKIESYSVMMLK